MDVYSKNTLIKGILDKYQEQIDDIIADYQTNLRPKLESYLNRMCTESMLAEIQLHIDDFIVKHDINITVCAEYYNQSVITFGSNITNHIIWNYIVS